jgi:glycosyltransferase involved in cell wall biosynthesis
MDRHCLVFLGYNNMFTHKRGVENVIHFQSQASPLELNYYLHWDNSTHVYRFENLVCIGIKKNLFWFISLNILLSRIKRKKKMFIHSHNPLMSIMSIYQSNLFTVHDALYYLTAGTKHRLNKVFWLLEKMLYWRTDFVHFISNYAKKMSLFSGDKNYVVLPNTSHFERVIANVDYQKYPEKSFGSAVIKVFTVRSIEERALINLIVDVAEKLIDKKVEFLIAGKGPLLDFYRKQIKEKKLANITLLGYVPDDDLMRYYRFCDLVLVPAAYGEGFGLPIIEGYLFNKPVIASAVCAIPEVILSDDFLFDNTVESLISKLYFADNKKEQDYLNYYNQRFSNKVVLSRMNELYKNLL